MSAQPGEFRPSRRGVIKAGIAGGVLLASGATVGQGQTRPDSLRVAHLTDMHVQPELRAGEGYALALESLKKLEPQPSFIITGGDHVFDATGQSRKRAELQWDLYDHVLAENTKLPVHPLLGNHDVWGWGNPDEVKEGDAGYGKAMALDRLKLKSRFYSFDAGGWHFVMLDSMTRRENSYFGQIDPEQLEWLRGDLGGAGSKPIAVFSHIPILAACVFFDEEGPPKDVTWKVSDGDMHHDCKTLTDVLAEHRVKVVVSGHIHLVDRVEYRGMTFVCDGAVSGNWWKGPRLQFPEGYGVFDLHSDGSFEHRYLDYGWKAET